MRLSLKYFGNTYATVLNRSSLLACLFLVFIFTPPALAQSIYNKNLELKNYYPSPSGSYKKFRLAPRPDIDTTQACTEDGAMFFHSVSNNLFYCNLGVWQEMKNVWNYNVSNQVFLKDLATNPEDKKVGLGTSNPYFAPTITTDQPATDVPQGGILAQGNLGAGTLISGTLSAAPYMLWYPRKAAFRAGYFNNLSDANIGNYSAAFGQNTLAYGDYSFAAGDSTEARGTASAAFGYQSKAWGEYSMAMGYQAVTGTAGSANTTGRSAFALGDNVLAQGNYSVVLGQNKSATADHSVYFGLDSTVKTISQANSMAITGGNVGLGTTDPQAVLDIARSGKVRIHSEGEDGSSDAARLILQGKTGNNAFAFVQSTSLLYPLVIGPYATNTKTFSGRPLMIFGGSGNGKGQVGIGLTAYTDYTLNMRSTGNDPQFLIESNTTFFELSTSNGTKNYKFESDLNNRLRLKYNNIDRVIFDGAGRLGIGPDLSPAAGLHLNNTGTLELFGANPYIIFDDETSNEDFRFFAPYGGADLRIQAGIAGAFFVTDLLHFYSSGNVGIGPNGIPETHRLYVAGNIEADVINASSKTVKENINELALEETISAFKALTPIKYQYIEDPMQDTQIGFIAEDVPQLLATPDRKGLNSIDFAAFLTRVAQYQEKLIEEQQQDIEILKKKLNTF